MTRALFAACCALLTAWISVSEAQQFPRGLGPGSRGKPEAGCPIFPARCQINPPTFNFGRHTMSLESGPINGNATISVTCTRHPQDGLSVDVAFDLKGLNVQGGARGMRDELGGNVIAYGMYVDAARTREWGDGSMGSAVLHGQCSLNDRNRVCTLAFPLYGQVPGQQAHPPPGKFNGAIAARLEYSFVGC
jgi:spore coat protein U-like protein